MSMTTVTAIPRPEFPRPQFDRGEANWLNLNGPWEYETDRGLSGEERGLQNRGATYHETITVPFCRESVLSGIGDTDFCDGAWYRKSLTLPEGWAGRRVLLHIGACDYKSRVWVNDRFMGEHIGGYVAFSFDITEALGEGENTIVIGVTDQIRTHNQPGGKQSFFYGSRGCHYTRTTGIWQTVWLELVPLTHIEGMKFYPEIEKSALRAEIAVKNGQGKTVSAAVKYDEREVGAASAVVKNGVATLDIALDELHLWEVGVGRLYDIELSIENDKVCSYFGMREIDCKNGILYLNGRPIFQRLVLDQGFYPDGIYTAPTLDALHRDVDISMEMGFNGARLHQKVFEPLFLEYCDRRGYIVWGEHANWGMPHKGDALYSLFMQEWQEIVLRDFNHPSIVGWCPINESPIDTDMTFLKKLADLTRAIDKTRLYIDASGWTHGYGITDILDAHDYEQDPAVFKEKYDGMLEGKKMNLHYFLKDGRYDAIPTFVSEYGGTWWSDAADGWGYGNSPKTEEEFKARFKGLTETLLQSPIIGGLCYTQLTDVEQEQNGLYTYDRRPKFAPEFFRKILTQKAKIEE